MSSKTLTDVIQHCKDGYYSLARPGWIAFVPNHPDLRDFSVIVASDTIDAWSLEFKYLAPNTWWAWNKGSAGPVEIALRRHFKSKNILLSEIRGILPP